MKTLILKTSGDGRQLRLTGGDTALMWDVVIELTGAVARLWPRFAELPGRG